MIIRHLQTYCTLVLIFLLSQCKTDNSYEYEEFVKLLRIDEPYIGFFATEKACIADLDDDYLSARKEFFLAISRAKEETDDAIEKFTKYCRKRAILENSCKDEWERVLTVLSYELYANMPIFDYRASNISEYRNIKYAEYPNKKLSLDLFLPAEPLNRPIPCIIAIHGGGWTVNRRIWFEPFAQYLASNGFAAVTIDYRKLPAVKLLDIVHDAKAAVRWVKANAEDYGIDPDRIGAIGASAGAHLAALLGTTSDIPELEGVGGNENVSSAIQAVVGIATPAFNSEKESWLHEMIGISKAEMKKISPLENIDSQSAPLYLIHGTTDRVVTPENSQDLFDKYLASGAYAELTWINGEGHGFYEGNDRAIRMATEFFLRQFSN